MSREPCTLEFYAKVKAAMVFPMGTKKDLHQVLSESGTDLAAWLECERYWGPIIAGVPTHEGAPNPKFDPEISARYFSLFEAEANRLHH
jgi:hypothetical protein